MEVNTCRERLIKYCKGSGLDLGFGGTAISRSAIAVDREEHNPCRAVNEHAMPTHLVGDVRNLYWFRDGVLDYVFSSHALEDFVDTEAILKEWLRVLKPGGYLVLFLPDEQVYRSVTPDEIRNQAHKHPDFSLQFVKNCLQNIGYNENTVVHEMWPVPNNIYSFDLVVQKPQVVPEQSVVASAPQPAPAPVAVVQPAPRQRNPASFENKKIIQLGHYGDIINILPIAQHLSDKIGKPMPIICKNDYANILDGVSYAVAEYAPDDFNPEKAASFSVLNTHAAHPKSDRRIPYNLQAWEQAGYLEHWRDLFPVFDRRSRYREAALVETYVTFEKPVMLVTLQGISSSLNFRTRAVLWKLITESFSNHFQIVDVGQIKAEKPYDLLGLIDVASVVITVDTMLLHLCTATNVPVVALTSIHPPVFWRGSAVKGNILRSLSYDKVIGSWNQIVRVIQNGHRQVALPTNDIIHVVPMPRGQSGDAARRIAAAQLSWNIFHDKGARMLRFDEERVFRFGNRALPYLKDAFKAAMAASSHQNDIICFTNADIILAPGFYGALQHRMQLCDYCCSFRMEFQKVDHGQPRCGTRTHGRDMFAFRRGWLAEHFDEIPDFLIGMGGWDYALAMWFRVLSGRMPEACDPAALMPDIEMEYGFVWHEKHDSAWYVNDGDAYHEAYRHNRACIETFFARLGLDKAHKDVK
jgi:SAM-dependent methyltransferase